MGTYVTETGFRGETLQEIKQRISGRFKTVFGDKLDTDGPGPAGQLIGELSALLADAWSINQEVYNSHNPNTAEGVALDVVCSLTNVRRIAAAASQCLVACYVPSANLGLTLGSGRQVKRVRGGAVFSLRESLTINTTACRDLYLTLSAAPSSGASVSLTTSFGTFSVTVSGTNTSLSAYQQIATAINTAVGSTIARAWADGAAPSDARVATARRKGRGPSASSSATISGTWVASLCGSVGWFDSVDLGPISAEAGEISQIVTPETGWSSCYNLSPAILGRYRETDAELRARRKQSFRAGYATETAIRQALLNRVPGIVDAIVISNRTREVDAEGREPHSFEVVVQGGVDADVAKVIFDTMPLGIESYADMSPLGGGVEVSVVDDFGFANVVRFSRPTTKYLRVFITLTLYSEETFPAEGLSLVQDAVLAWAQTEYTLGKDVIPQRILSPAYSVPGIGSVSVQVGISDSPTDGFVYSTTPIKVGGRTQVSLLPSNCFVGMEV